MRGFLYHLDVFVKLVLPQQVPDSCSATMQSSVVSCLAERRHNPAKGIAL